MNILITGGAGYIGSHVVATLSNYHNITIVDNLSNSKISTIKRLKKITNKEFMFYQNDIRDSGLLIDILLSQKIDAVIHLAGLKSVSESLLEPLEYYQNNVGGALSLLQAMSKANVNKLVFSSSATVYGYPISLPVSETHKTNPLTPYGQSKLIVEIILNDLANSNPEWGVVSLRYFNPAGAHESLLIGESPLSMPTNLIPLITDTLAGAKPYITIYGDDYDTPDGSGLRDFIHVMDLAEGHLSALNYLTIHNGSNIFNLGTGKPVTVFEILRKFEEISNLKIPYQVSPRRDGDIPISYACIKKAEQQLKWVAKKNIADICDSSLKWRTSSSYFD